MIPKSITYAELMAEVDKIQGTATLKGAELSVDQIKFIKKCRTKRLPLSWDQIRKLWNKMPDWQPYSNGDTIAKKYKKTLAK